MKQIVVISRSLPLHQLGGMEIVAWELCRALADRGWPVVLLTTSIQGIVAPFMKNGINVIPVPGTTPGRYSRAWWTKSRELFTAELMKDTAAVVSVSAGGFGLLKIKRKMRGIPFIMQAHGTSWGAILSKWRNPTLTGLLTSLRNVAYIFIDALAYQKCDAIVAVGDTVYRSLRSPALRWAIRAQKVHLIRNGIDTALFTPSLAGGSQCKKLLDFDPGAHVIMVASRLHAQKGVDNSLRVFSELLKRVPDCFLLIAGDGPERCRLEHLGQKLGITPRVRFLNRIPRNELVTYLQASDAFLFLTNKVEAGLTLNVLEALAVGVPVVVSDHMYVLKSSHLYPVRPRATKTVVDALCSILTTAGMRRESALPHEYTWEYAGGQYDKLIRQLGKPNVNAQCASDRALP